MKSLSSALVALGVATGSLLAPQAASALTVTFSFGGVEGLIQGLTDNDTSSGVVSVTGGATIPSAALGIYDYSAAGSFLVSSGQLLGADWSGSLVAPPFTSQLILQFGAYTGLPEGQGSGQLAVRNNGDINYLDNQPVTFNTIGDSGGVSVPAPLPLFGAAAAFGFSRKLRKRIKASRLRTTHPSNAVWAVRITSQA